jgi:Fe-S-cluster containining protein
VDLAPDEVDSARRHRLRVVAGGKAFEQPCVALGAGDDRACTVYAARPRACRVFVCRLHERHRHEGGPLGPRLAAVKRVRSLVAQLVAMRLTPADFEGEPATLRAPHPEGAHAERAFRELGRRLEEDFARAKPEAQ